MWFKNASYTPPEPLLVGTDYALSYYFHEVTHFFQASIIGRRFGSGPCWFDEGAAILVGEANTYEDFPRTVRQASAIRSSKLDELRRFLAKPVTSDSDVIKLLQDFPRSSSQCQIDFPQFGYGLGWFVNEKLVYDFGWSPYMAFWREMSGQEWQEAFSETYGLSYLTWVANNFAPYMVKLLNQ